MFKSALVKRQLTWPHLALLLYLGSLPTSHALAFDSEQQRYRLSGFATLAATRSGNEALGFRREFDREGLFDGDWSFTPDSIIGLQLDFNATENLSGAVQLVGKDRAENTLENSIEWAFLGYQWGNQWRLRAGRVGYDSLLASEYRNVGFAYLWVRPPTEYYTMVTFFSLDGADLTWTKTMGPGTLRVKALGGSTKNHTVFFDQVQELELDNIFGFNVGWESDNWRIRFSAVRHEYTLSEETFLGLGALADSLNQVSGFWPEAAEYADLLTVENNQVRYFALGSAYTNYPWQIQSELSYTDSRIEAYPSQLAGYVGVGYQLEQWTPYLLLAAARSESTLEVIAAPPVIPGNPLLNANLQQLQSVVQSTSDVRIADQTSFSAGVRWDFRHDMALKAQLDHTKVGEHGYSLWNVRNAPSEDQTINTLTVALDWVF